MKIFETDKFQILFAGFYALPNNHLRNVYLIIRIVNITIFLVHFSFVFKFTVDNVSDFTKIAGNLFYSITQFAFFCKAGNILLQTKKIIKIEEHIMDKVSINLNDEEEIIMNNSVNVGRILATAYRTALIVSLFFCCLNPFIKKNPDGSKRLLCSMSLPFDPMNYYYQVTFVLIIIVVLAAWINTNIDVFAFTLISFGTGQLEILKYKFERVTGPERNESEEVILRKLTTYAEELDDIYR